MIGRTEGEQASKFVACSMIHGTVAVEESEPPTTVSNPTPPAIISTHKITYL